MKTMIIAVIAVMLVVSAAAAQTVTLETDSKGNANVSVFHAQNHVFGFAGMCEGGWQQAYAGVTYAPTANTEVALGAGAETNGFRYGGWVWAGEGKFSLIHLFEGGGSGNWHRTIAKYAVSPDFTLGVTDRAFYGRGVRVERKLGADAKIIGEYYEGGKGTAALSYSF